MGKRASLGLVCIAGLQLGCAASAQNVAGARHSTASDEIGRAASDTMIVCSVSTPTASLFESVDAAVAVDPEDPGYSYAWSATRGRVMGDGASVRWLLNSGSNILGIDSIRVVVAKNGRRVGQCSARIRLIPHAGTRGPQDLTGRALLVRGSAESPGFGRYSYILFSATPRNTDVELYRQIVGEYLRSVPKLNDLLDALGESDPNARAKLNAAYLPIVQPLSPGTADTASAILSGYDYARARAILSALPGQHAGGPYLVSSRRALTTAQGVTQGYLVYDLASVPPSLVVPWVHQFLNDAAQQQDGGGWDARRSVLRLRTLLANIGRGVPEVDASIRKWKDFFAGWAEVKE